MVTSKTSDMWFLEAHETLDFLDFLPGHRCRQNPQICRITEGQLSNMNFSNRAMDIKKLLSYFENLVFLASTAFISCKNLHWSLNGRPLKKRNPKIDFQAWPKMVNFQHFFRILEKCLTLIGCSIYTSWLTAN